MSPTFLHLKWIVSFCYERAIITTPLFRYVCDSWTCVCVLRTRVPRIQKPARNLFGQLFRGGGGIKQHVRDLFGPLLRTGGGNSEMIRGGTKARILDSRYCFAIQGGPERKPARNGSKALLRGGRHRQTKRDELIRATASHALRTSEQNTSQNRKH